MRMNRRNVLIGLGTAVVGGGAAFGSGAFSSVEANRSVSVSAAGDGSALLQMSISGDLAGSGNTINFDLSNDVNADATTTFSGALTVTNNGNNSVYLQILDGSSNDMIDYGSGSSSSSDMVFVAPDSATNPIAIGSGSSATFDVEFDLNGTTDPTNASIPGSVTVRATESDPTL